MKKLFVVACLMLPLFVGCIDKSECEFQIGEMVEFKINPDVKGQVRELYRCGSENRWIGHEMYGVRISTPSMKTNTKLLGDDKPITHSGISMVRHIRPYEIQKIVGD